MIIRKGTLAAAICALLLASTVATAQRTAGENIDDKTLITAVKLELIDDPVVDAGDINVESYKGRVLLIGYVGSSGEQRAALARAATVDNVREVEDGLFTKTGKRSFGRVIDDETIRASAKLKLSKQEGLSSISDVIVMVHSGEVLVGGFVDSKDAAADVVKAVREIEGVKKVHNALRTKD